MLNPRTVLLIRSNKGMCSWRNVRGPERQASRRRIVLETLQRSVDARNMVPQGVLVEAEVMEVEQALRVSAKSHDGPRERVEVVGVDPEGNGRLIRHADRRSCGPRAI